MMYRKISHQFDGWYNVYHIQMRVASNQERVNRSEWQNLAPTMEEPVISSWEIIGKCQKGNSLRWRHNGHDCVSNHQRHDCLLNRLFRRRSKKTSKLRVTGLCAGNSPGTGEFPTQMASNAENVSIWWRHHGFENLLPYAVCVRMNICYTCVSPISIINDWSVHLFYINGNCGCNRHGYRAQVPKMSYARMI